MGAHARGRVENVRGRPLSRSGADVPEVIGTESRDPSAAAHQFGLTLMQLGKCDEALKVFGKVSDLDPTEDQYNDIVFRMGQCLVELERWEEASCTSAPV